MIRRILVRLLSIMPGQFQEVFVSQAIRDTAKVFSASLVASGLGLIGSIITIRNVSIEEFGSLAFFNNISAIAAGLILSGLNLGFVRFLSLYLKKDVGLAKLLTKKILWLELVCAVALMVISLTFAQPIAARFFGKPSLTPFVQMAGLMVLLTVAFSFFQSIFQSLKRFSLYAGLIIIQAVITNSIIVVLGFQHHLTAQRVVMTTVLTNSLLVLLAIIFYARTRLASAKPTMNEHPRFFRDILGYSKWLVLIAVSALLFTKLDVFMLTKMVDLTQVGVYSLANTVYAALLLLLGAVNTIIFPNISELESRAEMRRAIKRIFLFSTMLTGAIIPFLFLIEPAVNFVFGARYLAAMPVLTVMLIGFVISLALNPLLNMLLILNRQRFMALVNIGVLVYHVIGNLIFIPRFGVMGAVIVTSSGIAWSNVLMALKLLRIMRNESEPLHVEQESTTS